MVFRLFIRVRLKDRTRISCSVLEFAQVSVEDLEEFEGLIFVMGNSCLGSLGSFGLGFVIISLILIVLEVFNSRLHRLRLRVFTNFG